MTLIDDTEPLEYWHEYEAKKKILKATYPSCKEYQEGIKEILSILDEKYLQPKG